VLVFKQRANDSASTNLPADPGSLFSGALATQNLPDLVYPNDGVLVPPNLGKLEFHFKPGAGAQLFELGFANQATDIKIYLFCTTPLNGGCTSLPDPTVWHWLAETNRGGTDPVQVTLRATDGKGGAVGTSNMLAISFSQDDIEGGIYYWKIGK